MDYRNCQKFIEAERYLNEKRIPELLNSITSLVIFNQPENPYKFMVNVLKKLQNAQKGQGYNPFIFNVANAESIFDMMDPNVNGNISYKQYQHGLETLGITNYDIMPVGIGNNQITKATFLQEAQKGLDFLSSTYVQLPNTAQAHVEFETENTEKPTECEC